MWSTRTKRTYVAIVASMVALAATGAPSAHADKKVTLCHVPAGKVANLQTISVGEAAVSAHLAHGDELGACPTGCAFDAACDDGNACTSDACAASGECTHTAVSCDDGNPCSTDLCHASSGCLYVGDSGAACDDLNTCTQSDACNGTLCQGTPIADCCTSCEDCADLDPCTVDSCGEGGCTNLALDCGVADKCLAGYCDPTGACATVPVSCDDSNVCTDDLCDSVTGCSHLPTSSPPELAEVSCSDGADNDCDGLVDLADPDCDNGDGLD